MAKHIDVLFEDDELLIVNKPSGTLTVRGRQGGVALREVVARLLEIDYPLFLVHRLDRQTSGVLILAKTFEAKRQLSKQFERREVAKEYLALVRGAPEAESGVIHAPLGPHPQKVAQMVVDEKKGRPSQTKWVVVERFLGGINLLRCFPKTGRQHQIRVHLKQVGLPLLVDELYGESDAFYLSQIKGNYKSSKRHEERPLMGRLTLHAEALSFTHPRTGKQLRVEAPLPKDFRATLTQLRKLAR